LATTLQAQNLLVANYGNNTIGEYDTSGNAINASLITTGLYGPDAIGISGNNLFVSR
jgi:DNA-binding beta-propeller fold protein YncE